MNVYDCCHISIIIMSSPVCLCTPPLCTYCICFRFYEKTYVVFVVLNEEKKRSWICIWSLVHLRHSPFCFLVCFWVFLCCCCYMKIHLTESGNYCKGWHLLPLLYLFFVVSFPGVFFNGGGLRKWRIVNGDIIYTCTWWFSYIFIAYQRVLHLTRGYKVSQSSASS